MRVPRMRAWMIAVLAASFAALVIWWLFPEDTFSPAPHEPGAYDYATRGFEEVGILGGARHPYPPTTGITITRSGCGRVLEWRPLQDRSTAYELCHGSLHSIREVHDFFGRRDERVYGCASGSSLRRGWRCTFEDTTEVARGGVVGRERLDGARAIHVRLKTEISGDTEGSGRRDFWFRRSDGFPVRLAGTNDNVTDTFAGDVHYRERYLLTLERDAAGAGGG